MSDQCEMQPDLNSTKAAASPFPILIHIFLEPSQAFAQIGKKSHTWFPILLLSSVTVGLLYWYFQTVDMDWLREQLLSAQKDIPESEKKKVAKFFTRETLMWGSLIGAGLGTIIVTLILALYYLIAEKITNVNIGYGKWFAFSAWIGMPNLIGMILMAYQISSGGGRTTMEELNMLSLNSLVTHFPASHSWASLMNAISLPAIWSIILSVIGWRVWTHKSLRTCIIVSLIPSAVIYLGLMAKAIMAS